MSINLRHPAVLNKAKAYFAAPPCPSIILQLSSDYLSGIQIAVKEKKVKQHLIMPVPKGLVEPHFEKANLTDASSLAGLLKEGLQKLQVSGQGAACLLPEACFKVFVLPFESLPASEREREKLIFWRAKKQMPVLPEDIRLSYQVLESKASVRILAALARSPVIQEYEHLFAGLGIELGLVSMPTLSLLNLIDWEREGDVLLVNIEEDTLGLTAVTRSEIALYRVKSLAADRQGESPGLRRLENLVKEIENTIYFIEDREKQAVQSLWVRSGLGLPPEEVLAELKKRLTLAVKPIEAAPLAAFPPLERSVLLPLAGQIL